MAKQQIFLRLPFLLFEDYNSKLKIHNCLQIEPPFFITMKNMKFFYSTPN